MDLRCSHQGISTEGQAAFHRPWGILRSAGCSPGVRHAQYICIVELNCGIFFKPSKVCKKVLCCESTACWSGKAPHGWPVQVACAIAESPGSVARDMPSTQFWAQSSPWVQTLNLNYVQAPDWKMGLKSSLGPGTLAYNQVSLHFPDQLSISLGSHCSLVVQSQALSVCV